MSSISDCLEVEVFNSSGFVFLGLDGKEARVASMRVAVADTFPEPNRRLLQRYVDG
jgi:hypothetical protein